MPGVLLWSWDDTNEKWIPVISDTEGRIKMSIVIARLDDINDVDVPAPSDEDILYWDTAAGKWKAKASAAGAHASTHQNGGADEVNVGALSGLLADDQHVLDAEAKAAAVLAGAITNGETKAPTHDAVYDVKVTADAAQTAAEVDADIATHAGIATAHHTKYTDAEAKAQAEAAKLDDHAAPDDNTDLDASAALHGLMPKADKSKLDGVEAGADATPDANLTTKGKVELATAAETNTGTDATRAVTPDGLAGSKVAKRIFYVKVFDHDTAVATGDGKAHITIPEELNGMNLVAAHAAVYTVSSSGLPTVQIHNLTDTSDMLSTVITIDANEKNSYTAATPPVIDTGEDDVVTGDEIRIDVDVAGTGTKGLDVILTFQLP